MVNIIISGHSEMASGLQSSVQLIAGVFPQVKYINFSEGMDSAELKNKMLQAVDNHSSLFLVDLLGGTPFKMAAEIAMQNQQVKVAAGVNLPMILAVVFETELGLNELTELAVSSGTSAIKVFPK